MKTLLFFTMLLAFGNQALAVSSDQYEKPACEKRCELFCMKCGRVIYNCREGSCSKVYPKSKEFSTREVLECPFDKESLDMRELA